jgi:hypothetical protein
MRLALDYALFGEIQVPRWFSDQVRRIVPAATPVYIYADTMNDFNYYTGREVMPVVSTTAALDRLLQKRASGYLIIRERDLKRLPQLPVQWIVASEPDSSSHWELLELRPAVPSNSASSTSASGVTIGQTLSGALHKRRPGAVLVKRRTAAYFRISLARGMSLGSRLKTSLTAFSNSAPSSGLISSFAFLGVGKKLWVSHCLHKSLLQRRDAVLGVPGGSTYGRAAGPTL